MQTLHILTLKPAPVRKAFDHPDLVAALDGKQLKTMDDMLAHLDELLVWIEKNPNFRVGPVDKNGDRYFNLIIAP